MAANTTLAARGRAESRSSWWATQMQIAAAMAPVRGDTDGRHQARRDHGVRRELEAAVPARPPGGATRAVGRSRPGSPGRRSRGPAGRGSGRAPVRRRARTTSASAAYAATRSCAAGSRLPLARALCHCAKRPGQTRNLAALPGHRRRTLATPRPARRTTRVGAAAPEPRCRAARCPTRSARWPRSRAATPCCPPRPPAVTRRTPRSSKA